MFEYGHTTRHTGIIYSKGLDQHGVNVLSCHADSGHSLPRSYGGTTCMMNGAAVTMSAKKHSLTASGTYHDEIIEFSIAANKKSCGVEEHDGGNALESGETNRDLSG